MLPTDHLAFRSHVAVLQPKSKGAALNIAAEKLACLVLDRWQELAFPVLWQLRGKPSKSNLSRASQIRIDCFVNWLRSKPLLEGAFWLSSAFASWIDPDERSNKAMFFTPPALADRLIDSLISRGASFEGGVWHDPAGGGGAFIAPLAERFCRELVTKNHSPVEILNRISTSVTAIEIDPTLALLARHYVYMTLSLQIELVGGFPELQIFQADSLSFAQVCAFDVVICNPPYRKLASSEIVKFKDRHSDVMAGQSNLYGLFMKRSVQLLRPNGLAGLITPTSFISGLHFQKLRQYLLGNAKLLQMDFIHERLGIFIGVEQGAVATVFQKDAKGNQGLSQISTVVKGVVQPVGAVLLQRNAPVWMIPRGPQDVQLLKYATGCSSRLVDYGYQVRIGHFVAYRDNRQTFTEQTLPKKTKNIYPLLWAADITTHGTLDHGLHQRERGGALYVKNEDATPASGIEIRPSVVIQRVTSPDQKKRLVAAPVPPDFVKKWDGVIGENHVLLLVPTTEHPIISPINLAALISSAPVDTLYRCISGAVNISVHELSNLPLPSPGHLSKMISLRPFTDQLVLDAYSASATL